MLLSPFSQPNDAVKLIISVAKLGRYRVQNSNLVHDTDHSDAIFRVLYQNLQENVGINSTTSNYTKVATFKIIIH
jgi:hypothetical protein